MTDTVSPPAAVSSAGHKQHLGWALVLINVAQLMIVLDGTIANIALPFIGKDLDISQANLTWIVTGYSLGFGGLLLLGGRLGDLFGRRRIFMVGLAIFAAASLVGGISANEGMLLTGRALQGFGAALASPAALALIQNTFPAGPQRNRAMSVYAMMSGAGAAVGLILGGWLTGLHSVFGTSIDGWRMTFFINVPIGIIAAILAPFVLNESESSDGHLDIPGAITGTLGLLGIVFGLTRAGQADHGWGDGITIASLVVGVALLAMFAFIESRVAHPLLPVRIFANKVRGASFAAFLLAPAAMFAMFYFLSLFVQQIVGYSPLRAGFAFLPFSFGIVVGATAASILVARMQPRILAGIGTILAALALFMFSRISIEDSPAHVLAQIAAGNSAGDGYSYWAHLFPWIVVMSMGMGMTFVTLTLTAVHHVRSEDSGIGSGVLNTMQQVGGALGLATLSTVALHYITSRSHEVVPALVQGLGDKASALVPGTNTTMLQYATNEATFAHGASHAFLIGSVMMLAASAIIWLFVDVKHEELATDGPAAPVH